MRQASSELAAELVTTSESAFVSRLVALMDDPAELARVTALVRLHGGGDRLNSTLFGPPSLNEAAAFPEAVDHLLQHGAKLSAAAQARTKAGKLPLPVYLGKFRPPVSSASAASANANAKPAADAAASADSAAQTDAGKKEGGKSGKSPKKTVRRRGKKDEL